MYLKNVITKSTRSYLEDIKLLKKKIETSDSIIVGAGAGLSTSAGFIYNGDMFKKYMFDFINEYGITDFYSEYFRKKRLFCDNNKCWSSISKGRVW